LLAAGADIDAQDKNGAAALHRAVRHRCAAAVGALLELGANPLLKNKPGSTPFHLAVQNTGASGSGDPAAVAAQREIIREFLARGISARIKNDRGHTVYESATSQWIRDLLGEGAGSAAK
jgi:ankyrin repeat protein